MTDLNTPIRFLEEDISEDDLTRIHGYSDKIGRLADDLPHASLPWDFAKKNRARSYLRNVKALIPKIHQNGDAGRLGHTQAQVRKLRAQFSLLSRQYGFSCKGGA